MSNNVSIQVIISGAPSTHLYVSIFKMTICLSLFQVVKMVVKQSPFLILTVVWINFLFSPEQSYLLLQLHSTA